MKNTNMFLKLGLSALAGIVVTGSSFGGFMLLGEINQQKAEEQTQAQEIATLKNTIEKISSKVATLDKTVSADSRKLSNQEIVKKIKPATVYVQTDHGSGSGIVVDSGGYILTNAHVVDSAHIAMVKLFDGREFNGIVVMRDLAVDLAVIKISAANIAAVAIGDSDSVVSGDEVFTLGYPFGLGGDVSFKEGTVSRKFLYGNTAYLETSAEIHPGNSGGPLVNKFGEVIGVNTGVFGSYVSGIQVGETIKLAIPINAAKNIIGIMARHSR